MAFLTVNTADLELVDFVETEAVEVGDRYRTFNGSERSSIAARKREWRGVTRPLSPAEFSTYRGALQALPLACSGPALGGSVTCSATITSAPYIPDGTDHLRVIEFALREL